MNIFERELAGEIIRTTDPEYGQIMEVILKTMNLTKELNKLAIGDPKIPELVKEITGQEIDKDTLFMPPFYIDFGRNTKIGKKCVIQQCCTFFDRGGITIGNNVLIGPKVNLITLNHDLNSSDRSATYCKPIVIEDNVWIGINSTILQGVTLGKNCVVGANSLVTKDVPPNTIVAGNPARFIKTVQPPE